MLAPGDTLGVDVLATVTDTGNGSATSGLDYQAVLAQALTFPSGSSSGARLSLTLQSIDDPDIEGDETLQLVLGGSAGAQVQSPMHTVTITDDDVAGASHLVVTGTLLGGPSTSVSPGDLFDLGNAALGSGPNQALELVLQNAGADSIQLEPLRISGDTSDFSVDLNPGPASIPVASFGAFPFSLEQESAMHGACLSPDPLRQAALAGVDRLTLDGVELPGGGTLTLELERIESPFAPDAVLLLDGAVVDHRSLLGDLSLWKGSASGYVDSEVYLSFSSESSQGWVRLGEGLGELHLCTEYSSGEPVVRWLWGAQLAASYVGEAPGACQGDRLVPGSLSAAQLPGPTSESLTVGLSLSDARLAIETEYQLYAKFGSTTALTST